MSYQTFSHCVQLLHTTTPSHISGENTVTIATINRNDPSIKKKTHLTITINPRIILRIPAGSYIKKQPRKYTILASNNNYYWLIIYFLIIIMHNVLINYESVNPKHEGVGTIKIDNTLQQSEET